MALLFVGGIMKSLLDRRLACFILIEKTIPMGSWLGRIAGVGLAAWGARLLIAATPVP